MKDYLDYKAEDFVMDADFCAWVQGRASGETAAFWTSFRNSHPERKEELENALRIIQGFQAIDDIEIPAERINFLWARIRAGRRPVFVALHHQFVRYAAVFVLALVLGAVGYHLLQSKSEIEQLAYNEVSVTYGERSELTLNDGTRVWINSGSKLRFPNHFNTNKRRIYLEGEAFFDVSKKHSGEPFIVSTKAMDIKVLGTRFNVNAYTTDNVVVATLEEGKISAINNASREIQTIQPGEQLTLNVNSGEMVKREVDTDLYTSWKENLLRFQDAGFHDVVKKMERWYDVSITIDPSLKVDKHYTMTIKTESLREMLNLLSYTTPITYDIDENQVFIRRK